MVNIIWAQAMNGIIGKDGAIPWNVPEDMAFFKKQTMGGAVIMGRKTWESIPEKYRPLPGRVNIVISRNGSYTAPGALVTPGLKQALEIAEGAQSIWVCGGGEIYSQAMWFADRLFVTLIDAYPSIDDEVFMTRAPEIRSGEWQVEGKDDAWQTSTNGTRYCFIEYSRAPGALS